MEKSSYGSYKMQVKGSREKHDRCFFEVAAKRKEKETKSDVQKFIIDPARDAKRKKA